MEQSSRQFVHLHQHSHYSMLDGLSKVPDLVEKAVSQGSPALALTDHGVMYGAVELYTEAKKFGIKPIAGCEIYITNGSLTDREPRRGERNYYHLTLLAQNHEGYVNLMKITSEAHLRGFYYKPRIDHEVLEKHAAGVICLSGCMNSELSQAVLAGNTMEARRIIDWHRRVFGDNYYLEVQHHPSIPEQARLTVAMVEFAKEFNLPLVATTDSHYLCVDDAEAQDVLLCIQTGTKVDEPNRMTMKGELFDLKSPEEMIAAFADLPEAITNTLRIADKCDLEIPMGHNILPHFDVPDGKALDSYFDEKLAEGVKKRFGDNPPEAVRQRIKHEVDIIQAAGFKSYMLIVADFVNWAKEQKIMVGPGRGSAAGSMVAYVLNITEVDPLQHNLLFERFLNPERISMPDIDMDFADDRRGEVIDYVINKYGREKVAQIITFGTMASRAAVRDVGRALNMSYGEVDKIAKLVPPPQQGKYLPMSDHLAQVTELREIYESDERAKKLLDLAGKLEGTVRHASTHAAGVVVADRDLREYTPVQYSPSGEKVMVTQYSMKPIEKIGLLKMDFLGLKNLTIIQNALRIIRRIYDPNLDLSQIPFDDAKTYRLLANANTTGVFQLESEGMRRYLRELKPTVFNDISAMIALYRPGPLQFIPDFIARKQGRKKIEYLHPKLEAILGDTYGIAVFQEQVMQIARDLCGFSVGEADVLRKAMGKKDPALLAEQKDKFIAGALENGITKELAEKLFSFVEPFAMYGFNRAHTVSYGMIAYWTAYLKAHFPNAFMAAVMTSAQQNLDDIAKFIAECEHMGMKVLPPSVNRSFTGFAVVPETGEVIFGLNAIKNVGQKVSDLIVEQREAKGEYKDLPNFLTRAGRDVINRKTLESLILAGAMDEFGDRKVLYNSLDTLLGFASSHYAKVDSNQLGMFGESEMAQAATLKLNETELANQQEKLVWEREYLGTFVSSHPLKDLLPRLKGVVRPIKDLSGDDDNKGAKIAGVITRIQKVFTKNGDAMLFATMEDLAGTIEVIVFPKVLEATKGLWERDKVLLVSGKVNLKERAEDRGDEIIMIAEPKILAGEVIEVTESYLSQISEATEMLRPIEEADMLKPAVLTVNYFEYTEDGVLIKLPRSFTNGRLVELKRVISEYPGEMAVWLEIHVDGKWQKIKTGAKADRSTDLEKRLSSLLSSAH